MSKIRFSDYLKEYLDFNNISNKDFSNRIGISEQNLINILSGKQDLSSSIIENISIVTDIPTDYIYRVELNYKFETVIEEYLKDKNLTETKFLNKFNYKYLIENKWIDFLDCTDKNEIIKDILKFLRVSSPQKIYEIDKNIFFKSKNDKPELQLLWLEKCYRETLNQDIKEYKKENIEILVQYIKEQAKQEKFDKEDLIHKFNENGIALVIQEDIPSSKIRGAFKVHKDVPAIYLTLKHKRIADIYFALLHELAHCKSDFNKAKGTNLISNDKDVEIKRDEQAYSWMVDNQYYEELKKNSNYDISKENKFPKSFVIYRLANDQIVDYSSTEYQNYNKLLEK